MNPICSACDGESFRTYHVNPDVAFEVCTGCGLLFDEEYL